MLRILLLAPLAGGTPDWQEVELGAQGLERNIECHDTLILPFPGAQGLELHLETEGIFTVTFSSEVGADTQLYGPPWRYRALEPGPRVLEVDLRQTAGWSLTARPVLSFSGTGAIAIRRLRVLPPPADETAARKALDEACFWAPESVGHTTINFLTPLYWSLSRGEMLPSRIALFAAMVGFVFLGAVRAWRGNWSASLALTAAALGAFVAWDAIFLVRFLPMVELRPRLSSEERIRANYYFDRELGGLAVLARRTLGSEERIGVMGPTDDWFAPKALCFNLFPRRCVVMNSDEAEHTGLSGVERLRPDEIDAVVFFRSERPLPLGYTPVASLSKHAFIARRR